MSSPNDTTTTLNAGTGGDKMDESLVVQSDGATSAKRPRVVLGDDTGNLYDRDHPVPTADRDLRAAAERQRLLGLAKLDVHFQTRHRERLRHGDRLDLIDFRGPGGR